MNLQDFSFVEWVRNVLTTISTQAAFSCDLNRCKVRCTRMIMIILASNILIPVNHADQLLIQLK
jgi:hypothetical protein